MLTRFPLDPLPGHSAWLDGDWKLHRIPQSSGEFRYELYHLGEDAAETIDRADQQPERVQQMQRELLDWQRSVVHSLNGGDYAGR